MAEENNKNTTLPTKVEPDVDDLQNKAKLADRFLNIQEKEIEVRSKEVDFRALEENNAFEYAKRSLKTQLTDRQEERNFHKEVIGKTYWLAGFVILLFVGFGVYALFLGKEKIVMEIIKAIIYLGTGMFGGWAIGTRKKKDKIEDEVDG